MTISNCKLIDLPTYSDKRGALTYIEGAFDIPFEIRRVYYLYGSQGNQKRGMHAHKRLQQVLIPVFGLFYVTVDDGIKKKCFKMNNPSIGLFVDRKIWREITDFSNKSVCLVLASEHFDEEDYIHDYSAFRKLVTQT